MKIGILTVPFNNNYGGYLQAFALQSVLKKLGTEPVILNRRQNQHSHFDKIKLFIKALLKNRVFLRKSPYFFFYERTFEYKGKNMMSFVNRNMNPTSYKLKSHKELCNYIKEQKFNCIIVGSDQVWRPDYVPNIEEYFLSFVKSGVKKISYAASFGVDNPGYSQRQIDACGKYLQHFHAISLRESSGFDIIKSFGWLPKCDVQEVLDPTLLIEKKEYEKLAKNHLPKLDKDCLLVYVLDEDTSFNKIVTRISQIEKLKVSYIMDSHKWKSADYVMPSIEDWLAGFLNASFVVTDSFHGAVFSILFNKPFYVYINKTRGASRIQSLLHNFGLENRLLTSVDDIGKGNDIDWNLVNNARQRLVRKSLSFLKKSLNI